MKILTGFISRRALIIAIVIQALILLRWITGEQHEIYGDEGWHHLFLLNAIADLGNGFLTDLRRLYLFNDQYPPVFYLLSAPLTLSSSNAVLAGRIFVGLLSLVVVAVFFKLLRAIASPGIALVGVIVLLVGETYIEATRYFILEIGVILFLLLLLYFLYRYFLTRRTAYIWLASLAFTLGLLTKFNFPIYSIPLLVVALWLETKTIVNARLDFFRLAGILFRFSIFPLIFAGPLYIQKLSISRGPLAHLDVMLRVEHLTRPQSFTDFILGIAKLLIAPFPGFVYVSFAVLGLIWLLRRKGILIRREKNGRSSTASEQMVIYSAVVFMVLIPVMLHLIGLGGEKRWNLTYLFIPILLCFFLNQLPWQRVRIGLSLLIIVPLTVTLVDSHFARVKAMPLLTTGRIHGRPPQRGTSGMRDVASIIDEHHRTLHARVPNRRVFLVFHEHFGAHDGALNFYFRKLGSKLTSGTIGGANRPVDLNRFLTSNYMVLLNPKKAAWSVNNEIHRYRQFVSRLPKNFLNALDNIGEVRSRFGRLVIYYRPSVPVPVNIVRELTSVGMKLEKGLPYYAFWYIEELKARMNLDPELVLRSEIEQLIADYPKLQAELRPHIFAMLTQRVNQLEEMLTGINFEQRGSALNALDVKIDRYGGYIEKIVPAIGCFQVVGWAGFPAVEQPAEAVWMSVDGRLQFETRSFALRPDVARNLGIAALIRSGFSACIPFKFFPPGKQTEIRVFAVAKDAMMAELKTLAERTVRGP